MWNGPPYSAFHAHAKWIRSLLGALAIAACGLGVLACGDSSRGVESQVSSGAGARTVAANFSTHNNDRDNDGDHNDDDGGTLDYGHAADATVRRLSVTLVTRYFAAAAAQNGVEACSLLVPLVAESVAEEDGHSPGLLGKTCAVVMSKLFQRHHRQLVEENASLKVVAVRVKGNRGLVVLEFPEIPEVRRISERRVHGAWRVLDLLDNMLE